MGVDGTLTPGCCSFLGLASLPGSAECEEVTLGARRVRGRGSLGRGHRKGRGRGGLVVGGLAPREATLSGDAVGISELGPAEVSGANLLDQAKPARVLSGQTQFRRPQTNLESL